MITGDQKTDEVSMPQVQESPPATSKADRPRKWIVNVYGKLPQQLEVLAKDRETAEEAAMQMVLDGIEFHGHSAE